MRLTLALVICCTSVSAARADFDLEQVSRRAHARRHNALVLTGVGAAFTGLAVAGLAVLASSGACGDELSSLACESQRVVTGGTIAGGALAVAVPLFSVGFGLLRASHDDAILAPNATWHETLQSRVEHRWRMGRALTITGVVVAAVGIAFSATSVLSFPKTDQAPLFVASTTLAAVHGAASLALISGGITFWVTGSKDGRQLRMSLAPSTTSAP
jgi:hypothetical protein